MAENARLSSIVANLTHELKTPLHAILSVTQLLLSEADGELNEEQTRQLEIIRRNGEGLLQLINELLSFSSVDSRKVSLSEINLPEFIREVALTIMLANRAVKLDVHTERLAPLFVTDSTLLRQIVQNLVTNAVKFSPPGSQVSIFAETLETGELRLEVADSGVGIPLEAQHAIFAEFYQLEHGDNRRFGGVGLGLALVRSAVDALGGIIELRSETGQGTLFRVALPKRELKKPRVLVVDHDASSRLVLEQCLGSKGFEVDLLPERELTLERIADSHPAVVLLGFYDDGDLETLLQVKDAWADLPVILVSSFDRAGERAKAFQHGATDYILKPFDLDELLARVRTHLRA